MLKKLTTSKRKFQKRRDFLSRSAAVGGMALLGVSAGPVHAMGTSCGSARSVPTRSRAVQPGDARVKDFTDLVGQQFRLQTEDGAEVHATLVETNSPTKRRALRFRREQFSLIFDVPGSIELIQGQYRLSHPQVGSMALFMVPVDLPAKHNRLEAVFT